MGSKSTLWRTAAHYGGCTEGRQYGTAPAPGVIPNPALIRAPVFSRSRSWRMVLACFCIHGWKAWQRIKGARHGERMLCAWYMGAEVSRVSEFPQFSSAPRWRKLPLAWCMGSKITLWRSAAKTRWGLRSEGAEGAAWRCMAGQQGMTLLRRSHA